MLLFFCNFKHSKNLNDYNYIIENAVKSEQLTKIGNTIETVNVTGFSSFRNIMGSTESWFMFGIIACICYAFLFGIETLMVEVNLYIHL